MDNNNDVKKEKNVPIKEVYKNTIRNIKKRIDNKHSNHLNYNVISNHHYEYVFYDIKK